MTRPEYFPKITQTAMAESTMAVYNDVASIPSITPWCTMPKTKYREIPLALKSLAKIAKANEIIAEYAKQGFDLTLRQLYYQFVSRGLIANNQKEYKALGDVINNGRLAGLINWDAITDRTRNLRSSSHWSTPASIIEGCAYSYRNDLWAKQLNRMEVWIEKDALIGVLESVCPTLRVPYFSCRGYVSQSEMWAAAQRHKRHQDAGQTVVLLHLGDHDPSGVDMTRDIAERLDMFGSLCLVKRIALTMAQIRTHNPPPNPVKPTDIRTSGYAAKYGDECWELDALEPAVLVKLIDDEVRAYRDEKAWAKGVKIEEEGKKLLKGTADNWTTVAKAVKALAKRKPKKSQGEGQ